MYWVRTGRRWLAAVALVSLSCAGVWSSVAHAGDCHDGEALVAVVHDASAHAFRGATSTAGAHPLHCVLCHTARVLRPTADPIHAFVPVATGGLRSRVFDAFVTQVFPAAHPPLRSPPASASRTLLA
jgi:hypothetical protein